MNKYHSSECNLNTLLLFKNQQPSYEPRLSSPSSEKAAIENLDVTQIPAQLEVPPPQLLAPHREGEEVVATLLLQMADLNPGPLMQLGQLVALQVNSQYRPTAMIQILHVQTDVRM